MVPLLLYLGIISIRWFYPLQNFLTMLHLSLRSHNVKPMRLNISRGAEVVVSRKMVPVVVVVKTTKWWAWWWS
jgi:hypothetical protein